MGVAYRVAPYILLLKVEMELLKSPSHWPYTSSCVIVTQSRAVYGQSEIVWLATATTTMFIGETTSAFSANKVSSHPISIVSV